MIHMTSYNHNNNNNNNNNTDEPPIEPPVFSCFQVDTFSFNDILNLQLSPLISSPQSSSLGSDSPKTNHPSPFLSNNTILTDSFILKQSFDPFDLNASIPLSSEIPSLRQPPSSLFNQHRPFLKKIPSFSLDSIDNEKIDLKQETHHHVHRNEEKRTNEDGEEEEDIDENEIQHYFDISLLENDDHHIEKEEEEEEGKERIENDCNDDEKEISDFISKKTQPITIQSPSTPSTSSTSSWSLSLSLSSSSSTVKSKELDQSWQLTDNEFSNVSLSLPYSSIYKNTTNIWKTTFPLTATHTSFNNHNEHHDPFNDDEFDPTFSFYDPHHYDDYSSTSPLFQQQPYSNYYYQTEDDFFFSNNNNNNNNNELSSSASASSLSALEILTDLFPEYTKNDIHTILSSVNYDMDRALESFMPQSAMFIKKRQICRHFLQGDCHRQDCRFAHTNNLKFKVCKFWLQEDCLKGDGCEFLHHIDVQGIQEIKEQIELKQSNENQPIKEKKANHKNKHKNPSSHPNHSNNNNNNNNNNNDIDNKKNKWKRYRKKKNNHSNASLSSSTSNLDKVVPNDNSQHHLRHHSNFILENHQDEFPALSRSTITSSSTINNKTTLSKLMNTSLMKTPSSSSTTSTTCKNFAQIVAKSNLSLKKN
ncbi:unnamed protein product [Cunninghamella blakesleeana]